MNQETKSHVGHPTATASQLVDFNPQPGQASVKQIIQAKESPSPSSVDDSEVEITYPEGGIEAWSVVLGSWCAMTAGFGIVNSTGVLQAYISNTILSSSSLNAVGWIFGLYIFVSYIFSVQIGPIFDARGPKELIFIGGICLLVGTFTLGQCTTYYQFLLSFSILSGIGNSFLFTPAMGAISHWFDKRRGTASGLALTGSSLGGILFPLMVQNLIPKVGWAWTMRTVGFVFLVLWALSLFLCKSRLPPKKGAEASWRNVLPSTRIFRDGTGAMAVTTAGVFLIEWAYFVPVSYLPSYYLARQGLTGNNSVSGDAAFAYQLLAILNGASCIGRYLPGYIADKIGRYNTMIISSFLAMASVLGLWLPDALLGKPPSLALLIVFDVVFGFVSGANVTLVPVCLGQLCSTQEYGRYYASAFIFCAFGCLTSIPVAGNILTATGEAGRKGFWGVILFAGVSYIVAFSCFLWVRIRVKGTCLRIIW
ncbi:riboflavin transporter MCH5 protein [Rutstroemia sp. NJR-2017a WRK4]|nr:riboflavin transporter MCH5 protein [Rutstroemia sp. NJR-2017a WRK4]